MFNSFKRKLPEISIFHHPSSPPSTKALALLKNSLQGPYPPTNPTNPPLAFNLSIVENPPTEDQLKTIQTFIRPSSSSSSSSSSSPSYTSPGLTFLSAFPGTQAPEALHAATAKDVVDLALKNPKALKYPIVVDWGSGQAAVGDVEGVKRMLEDVRKRRDGEKLTGDEVDEPKGWFM
ncbi:hypothetical protein CVT24_001325 [Panaeolus cyanescens]|uniref:Thioredoxin-like fold domain-containing protein n=1 Tax=Panaeolus cyanescens TaxID=181874 RepID=A0A409WS41_9AGAR|nr:hypothetical protein CVT24_001325 [Panaeolus cyanescens]